MARRRAAALVAAALSIGVLYLGLRLGALVAGGSDSYGYVSEAGLWRHGLPIVHQDIVRTSPWPRAAQTWTPLGYRASPRLPDAIVPVYAPGLPLLMALLQAIVGSCGAFLVVPLCGALTIWLTFTLGRQLFEPPAVALWGAALVATSPVFLYQLMNAMSDVPVTAAWTLVLVLAVAGRPLASGIATGAALAIRPNLAPLAIVVAAWIGLTAAASWTASLSGERRRSAKSLALHAGGHVVRFLVGVAPAVLGLGWLNAQLYESPLTFGYGKTSAFYSFGYLSTNVRQFVTWTLDVETPVVVLAALYVAVPRLFPPPRVRCARLLLGGTMSVVVLSYLFYVPFGAWWFLRFLLPMWPVMMLLTAASLDALARRWLRPAYPVVIAVIAALIAGHGVKTAADRWAFDLWRGERRYIDVGRFMAARTEPGAVLFSMQHSGSLRLYAGRLTLRYDLLDPAWLDRTVEHLRSIGRRPYFVLDEFEIDVFKQRFARRNRSGTLDWPPMATLGTTVAIYDPIDQKLDTPPLAIASTRTRRGSWLCDPPQVCPAVGTPASP
jgi:hypothetical protein